MGVGLASRCHQVSHHMYLSRPPFDHHQACLRIAPETSEASLKWVCMKKGTAISAEVWEWELGWMYRKETEGLSLSAQAWTAAFTLHFLPQSS